MGAVRDDLAGPQDSFPKLHVFFHYYKTFKTALASIELLSFTLGYLCAIRRSSFVVCLYQLLSSPIHWNTMASASL